MRSLSRSTATAAFAAIFATAIFSHADAPPDQYELFTPQATSITDQQTGLIWTRVSSSSKSDQPTALGICTAANSQRLPTYRELLTLVDESPHDEWDPEAGVATPRYIDPNAFPGTPADKFWTMSPSVTHPGQFMVVDFGDGEASSAEPGDTAYARCVQDPLN